MTLQSDLDLQEQWSDELLDWTDDSEVNIRETRNTCVDNIRARSANFKHDYASVRDWLSNELGVSWPAESIIFAWIYEIVEIPDSSYILSFNKHYLNSF